MKMQRYTPCTDLPDIMDFDDEGEWVRFTDAQAAIDAAYDRALEDAARVAYEHGCFQQELRTAALSSAWPENASIHLAAEQVAFAVAAAIRAMKKGNTDGA
jgi:hypothetical protein